MSPLRPLMLTAVALALLVGAPAVGAAAEPGGFVLEWGPAKKANRPAEQALRRSGAVEAVLAEINARYGLPVDVPVGISDALTVGPAFVPVGKGIDQAFIFTPASFLTTTRTELRRALEGSHIGATRGMILNYQWVLSHEIGHALVDLLDLPTTGREEDAVDGFAAFLLIGNPRFGPDTAISAAAFFDAVARKGSPLSDSHFADTHSLPRQRIYQFLCWVYGSDTKRFRGIVGRDLLPKERATGCRAEWRQVNRSWSTLLAPYARTARAVE